MKAKADGALASLARESERFREKLALLDGPLQASADAADAADADKSSSCTIPVTNPATGELLVRVPNMGATETRAAVAAASDAFPGWSRRSSASRGALLRRWNDLIVQHGDDLARIMVAEQGKPMAEAKGEVGYAASFVGWFAEVGIKFRYELVVGAGVELMA